jgi:uncharacterized OsmC-like protein
MSIGTAAATRPSKNPKTLRRAAVVGMTAVDCKRPARRRARLRGQVSGARSFGAEGAGPVLAFSVVEKEASMKLIVESAGSVASRVVIGTHVLVFDQPATVKGGDDRGPSPLDVLVASIAGCAHYFAAAFLRARGLSTAALTVEVDAEKESVPTPRIGRLALKVRVPAGLSEPHRLGMVRAIERCPAYGTLVKPPVVELSVEAVPGAESGEGLDEHVSA